MDCQILEKLEKKSITKNELFRNAEADSSLIPILFEGISSPKASVRYGCSKVLMDLSGKHPKKMNPYMDAFIALLDSKHRILVWNALAAIANLCVVDEEKKFDAIFEKYFGFLKDEYLVTVANTVGNSAKIASAKQYLIPKITNELLKTEHIPTTPHLTDECKLVIAEHAIKSLNQFFEKMSHQERTKVMFFVKQYSNSTRKKLKIKANEFLKRWGS